MAKVLLLNSINVTTAGTSALRYKKIIGNCTSALFSNSETQATNLWRTNGTLTNLFVYVINNGISQASTLRVRKATVSQTLVASITASTTGFFEDNVHSDTVVAGNDIHALLTTGSSGTTMIARSSSVVFLSNTGTIYHFGISTNTNNNGFAIATASATRFGAFYGSTAADTASVDSTVGITCRMAGTLQNLYAYSLANARTTTTTINSRVNSANGNLTLSIGAGVTGSFEDTVNTDTIAVNDLINWSSVTSTGTETLGVETISADFLTMNSLYQLVCGTIAGLAQNANVTNYFYVSGGINASTTESDQAIESNLNCTFSKLQCNISASTIVEDSTLRLRIDGANSTQVVAITGLTTGIFQDATHSDIVLASSLINYSFVTGATGISLTINSISILVDSSASGGGGGPAEYLLLLGV